jgi:hypothetical protein
LDGLSASPEAMLSDEDVVGDGGFEPASASAGIEVISDVEPEAQVDDAPARKARAPRRSRAKAVAADVETPVSETVNEAPTPEPMRAPEPEPEHPAPVMAETVAPPPVSAPEVAAPPPAPAEPEGPKKTGWWNRGKK